MFGVQRYWFHEEAEALFFIAIYKTQEVILAQSDSKL